jgi:hypothetical protein
MKSRYFHCLWLLIFPVCIFAQMQITGQDIVNLDQAVGIYENSTAFGLAVDMKTDGPNQAWDLSDLSMGDSTTFTRYEFVHTAGTELASYYPQCNYAHIESQVEDGSWALTSFIQLKSDSLQIVGCRDSSEAEVSMRGHGDAYYYPIPLDYGTTWTSAKIDSFGINDVMIDTMYRTIDAYGTVQLPVGTFNCLRVRTITKEVTDWGTFWFIQYMFISKENLLLAIVQGMPDDTTHNFSDALYVQRFYSLTTDVIKDRSAQSQIPKAFHLRQNYPNPFNPSTKLVFDVPVYGRVDLTVYNIQGERVKTLCSGVFYPGTYTAGWDATDFMNNPVSSGVYFCQLRGHGFREVKRMLLLR